VRSVRVWLRLLDVERAVAEVWTAIEGVEIEADERCARRQGSPPAARPEPVRDLPAALSGR